MCDPLQAKTNIPGKGKGKVISNKGDGVAAQQFQLRLGKNTTVPITLGFTKSNELFVGRLAMIGFAAACIGEVVSGQGCACHLASAMQALCWPGHHPHCDALSPSLLRNHPT